RPVPGQEGVPDRLAGVPGDQVCPLLAEPVEREARVDELDLLLRERPDRQTRRRRNVSAPCLSSHSLRLPHFGLWTQDGQPSEQGQPESIRLVSSTQPSNRSKPRSAMPTPPGWPS